MVDGVKSYTVNVDVNGTDEIEKKKVFKNDVDTNTI